MVLRANQSCTSRTCSSLQSGHGDGLDDGGPRFGGPRGHAQNGGLGGGCLTCAEDGLFTIGRQLEDGSCWEAALCLEQGELIRGSEKLLSNCKGECEGQVL